MTENTLKDGFTPIPNSVFEAMFMADLSKREWSVLMCIIRKTWGVREDENTITSGLIEHITGVDSSNVRKCISDLVSRKIINKSGNKFAPILAVNMPVSEWATANNGSKQPEKRAKTTRLVAGQNNPRNGPKQPDLGKEKRAKTTRPIGPKQPAYSGQNNPTLHTTDTLTDIYTDHRTGPEHTRRVENDEPPTRGIDRWQASGSEPRDDYAENTPLSFGIASSILKAAGTPSAYISRRPEIIKNWVERGHTAGHLKLALVQARLAKGSEPVGPPYLNPIMTRIHRNPEEVLDEANNRSHGKSHRRVDQLWDWCISLGTENAATG